MSLLHKQPKPRPGARLNRTHPQARGLRGWWLLNEGGGLKAHDSSGHGDHGDFESSMDPAADWIHGQFGPAVDFDQVKDWIDIPDCENLDLAGVNRASFMAWMYPRTEGENNQGRIIDKDGGTSCANNWGWTFRLNNSRSLNLAVNACTGTWNATSNTTAYNFNAWSHVAACWNGSTVFFYVNGVGVGSGTVNSGPINASTTVCRIGARPDGNREFDGYLDDVRVYDRCVQQEELFQILRNPWGPFRRPRPVGLAVAPPVGGNPKGPLGMPLNGPTQRVVGP